MKGKDKIEQLFILVKELTIRLDQETEQRDETFAYASDMVRHLNETYDTTNEQNYLHVKFIESLDRFVRSKKYEHM